MQDRQRRRARVASASTCSGPTLWASSHRGNVGPARGKATPLKLDIDLASLDSAARLAMIHEADDEEIERALDSERRGEVLDAIFALMADRFDPGSAAGMDAVIHFKVWDRPGGGYDHYEIVIREGSCRVNNPPTEEPRLTLKARPADFVRIALGNASGFRLALRGRLRVVGDVALARKVPDLFPLAEK